MIFFLNRQLRQIFFPQEPKQAYLEKMQVFEETFGIDNLLKLVSKVGDRLNETDKYDPLNNKFLMDKKDLDDSSEPNEEK